MTKLEKDILYLDSILDGDKTITEDTFCKLYPLTNDSINTISRFLPDCLENNDLFTVLSSGDFLFTSLINGVKEVDAFDVNPLTYRYFYFRKWLLENGLIDAVDVDLDLLKEIITKKMNAEDIDEQESAILWYHYLDRLKQQGGKDFYDTKVFSIAKRIVLPYKDSMSQVSSELDNRKVHFYRGNICSEDFERPDRQYDFVYLSNILDYNRKVERLEAVTSNLDKLLTDEGIVMCTTMFNRIGLQLLEIPLFKEKYHFSYIPESDGRTRTYVYQKK